EKLMAGKSGGQELADRYRQEVDFTKKPADATQVAAAPAGPKQNPCSLEDAKARIAYERESLDSIGKSNAAQPKTKPPANCQLEDAKAKIEEARALLNSVDQGGNASTGQQASSNSTGTGAAKKTSTPAKKTTPK